MSTTCTIKIKDAHFYSYHGFYPEENQLGNDYRVSIEATLPLSALVADNMENTLNYELLYRIAKTEMERPRRLLETLAQGMLEEVKKCSPLCEAISIVITKLNPPFGGDKACSEIELHWNRKD